MRLLHELRRELLGFLTGQLHGVCVLRGARDHQLCFSTEAFLLLN
jgi:hypothetical protein